MDELQEHFEDLLESDQSDPQVQYEIGRCYQEGKGVEKDLRLAEKWLKRAAEQGHQEARALLDSASPAQDVGGRVTEATLPKWCARAEDGDPEAQYQVAQYLAHQEGVPYDNVYGEVQRYLAEAAEQGHPQACCELGLHLVYYETNRAEEGVKYLRNAADCNVKDAMSALAECCARGVGTPRNLEEAERWYCKAAAQGSPEDKIAMAVRYGVGDCVEQSQGKALAWVQRASDAGMPDAMGQYNQKVNAWKQAQEQRRQEAEEAERRRLQAEADAALAAQKKREAEEQRKRAAAEAQRKAQLQAAAQAREAQRKREEEARRRQAEEARRLQMELEAKARQWDPLEGPLLAFLTWPVLGFPIGWILSQTHWAVTRQVLAWPFLTPMLWRLRWLHPFLVWVVWAALLAFGWERLEFLTKKRLEVPEVKLMAWFQKHGVSLYLLAGVLGVLAIVATFGF